MTSGAERTLECDLPVVGGGAAGLSGAVTAAYHGLTVIVAEKAPVLGGATSWSGGWMWAPLNPLSQADGIIEDVDAPRTYLRHALGENYDEPRVEAFLENARHMVGFFEEHTALQFVSGTWIADIQGDLPGAGTGGRSVGPKPINLRRIGAMAEGQREYLQGVIEFYQARTNTKMTIAAERLAVIAAVTLPVTALSSIVGMNVIVNQSTHVGQLVALLAVMGVMSTGLLIWAHRKGWW